MTPSCQQIAFSEFGVPSEVAILRSGESGEAGRGEILVKMLYAPINPADLNFMQGNYGIRPELPAVAGTEGVARVMECGEDVTDLAAGDLVIVINRTGCWTTRLVLKSSEVVKIPPGIDLEQACMLKINPLTAWCMLRTIVDLEPGEFVVQNAANSGVGMAAAQLAAGAEFKMIHFVRSEEAAAQVRSKSGAEHVFLDNKEGAEGAMKVIGDGKVRLALNAVGGESALRLLALLGKDGTHVTYGAMSRQSLKVPNSFLIFRNLCLRGFWVTEWLKAQSAQKLEEVYGMLAALMLEGKLQTPVDRVYPMTEITEALRHAAQSSRRGKILLRLEGD